MREGAAPSEICLAGTLQFLEHYSSEDFDLTSFTMNALSGITCEILALFTSYRDAQHSEITTSPGVRVCKIIDILKMTIPIPIPISIPIHDANHSANFRRR